MARAFRLTSLPVRFEKQTSRRSRWSTRREVRPDRI